MFVKLYQTLIGSKIAFISFLKSRTKGVYKVKNSVYPNNYMIICFAISINSRGIAKDVALF